MSGNNNPYEPATMFKEWIQKGGKAQMNFMKTFGSMMNPKQEFNQAETLKEITSMGAKAMDRAFKLAQSLPQFLTWGAFKTSVGTNGRISIPEAERDALGLKEGNLVQVVIIPVEKKSKKSEVK